MSIDPMSLTAEETLARAFYEQFRGYTPVEYPEWHEAKEIYVKVFTRRARLALTALKPMLEAVADDVDAGADVYSRLRMMGLLIDEY